MADFTLPSGRILESHEPTYGDEMDVVLAAPPDVKEVIFLKYAVVFPALSREDIRALSREDGHALMRETKRIWDGAPPLEPSSPQPS